MKLFRDEIVPLKLGSLYKLNYRIFSVQTNKHYEIGQLMLCLTDKKVCTGTANFFIDNEIVQLYLCLPTKFNLEEVKC